MRPSRKGWHVDERVAPGAFRRSKYPARRRDPEKRNRAPSDNIDISLAKRTSHSNFRDSKTALFFWRPRVCQWLAHAPMTVLSNPGFGR